MAPYCLETRDLSHRFTDTALVLDNINLQVPEGSIYGFLGPNGAGKTTTLRLVLGLLKKQQGSISFFGLPFSRERINILKRVGSLIESPSFYGHLTATENLVVLQKIYECPRERVAEVLSIVGLQNTGSKTAGRFSLGMKQRLSIAIALLNSPSILILDEPTNGLDPNGIIQVRELLKQLNKDLGITIIVSSHLLPEIEKMVTHIGIINIGKLMFQGTQEELKVKQAQVLSFSVETNNNVKAAEIISRGNVSIRLGEGKIVLPALSKREIASINQQLVSHGLDVYEISAERNDLEAIFMNLINN